MDNLIPLINKLQDVFITISVTNPIDLPQIVVIGRYIDVHLMHLFYFIVRVVARVQCLRISWERIFSPEALVL